ncbi:MAG TPA: GNAT family N-acetyltransferase [Thermoanaerobaculia bacterium]
MDRPTLHTKRLTLRPMTLADAPELHRLVNDVEIARNTATIPHPYPAGMAAEWIAGHQEKFDKNIEIVFGIERREDGAFLGVIGILPEPHDMAEFGYWIGQEYWNRGYATEAAAAVIDYGFRILGVNRVEAIHFTRNPASGRVMEKCGMHCEGTLRQARKKWDEYLDVKVYAIIRSDYVGCGS